MQDRMFSRRKQGACVTSALHDRYSENGSARQAETAFQP